MSTNLFSLGRDLESLAHFWRNGHRSGAMLHSAHKQLQQQKVVRPELENSAAALREVIPVATEMLRQRADDEHQSYVADMLMVIARETVRCGMRSPGHVFTCDMTVFRRVTSATESVRETQGQAIIRVVHDVFNLLAPLFFLSSDHDQVFNASSSRLKMKWLNGEVQKTTNLIRKLLMLTNWLEQDDGKIRLVITNYLLPRLIGFLDQIYDVVTSPQFTGDAELKDVIVSTMSRLSDLEGLDAAKSWSKKKPLSLATPIPLDLITRRVGPGVQIVYGLERKPWSIAISANDFWWIALNLVTNAADAMSRFLKASSKSKQRLEISTHNRVLTIESLESLKQGASLIHGESSTGDFLELRVQDYATGIDPSILPFIFMPRVSGNGSSGIGLSTVAALVKKANGFIEVITSGQGTCFSVYLPRLKESATVNMDLELPEVEKPVILIVDDNVFLSRSIERILNHNGFYVLSSPSGDEAIQVAKEWYLHDPARRPIQSIIIDFHMPGLSTGETITELRALDPHMKVIVHSGDQLPTKLVEARPDISFLQKPYLPRQIVDLLKTITKTNN